MTTLVARLVLLFLMLAALPAIADDAFPIGRCVTETKVKSRLPTVVITHGWRYRNSDFGVPDDLLEMGREIRVRMKQSAGTDVNVVYYYWPEASRPLQSGAWRMALILGSAISIGQTSAKDGECLAKSLRAMLGRNYRQPVHFISHSFGAFVTAHAVNRLLLDSSWKSAVQITTLDTSYATTRMGGSGVVELLSAPSVSGMHVVEYDTIIGFPLRGVGTPLLHGNAVFPCRNQMVMRGHLGVISYYAQTVTGEIPEGGFNESILLQVPNARKPGRTARVASSSQSLPTPFIQ